MKKIFKITIILLLLSLAGCGQSNDTAPVVTNELTIEQIKYLESLGLTVVSFEEEPSYTFELTREWVIDDIAWGRVFKYLEVFDNVDANKYIGETLDSYKFVVEGHSSAQWGDTNQSFVFILVADNKIVGGFTAPRSRQEELDGGPYPLDGETGDFEEKAGMTFDEFDEYWERKFYVE